MAVLDTAFRFPKIGRTHWRKSRVECDQVTKWFDCKETAHSTKTLKLKRVDESQVDDTRIPFHAEIFFQELFEHRKLHVNAMGSYDAP